MKLCVGLGNPGPRYAETRHNAGFRVVEALARRLGIGAWQERFQSRFARERVALAGRVVDLGLLLPQTFMNRSGDAVFEALCALPVASPEEDLIAVYDDVDLPLGRLRLRPAGGTGGHRGLAHIVERLGTRLVPRLRFGVGRPPGFTDTRDYVLQAFADEEAPALAEAIERAVTALETFLTRGIREAMSACNAPPSPGRAPADRAP